MNLALDKGELLEKSMNNVLGSGSIAHDMGAKYVVIHGGFYGRKSKKEALKLVKGNVRKLRNAYVKKKLKPRIALEVAGKQKLFGSLDEVLEVCKSVKDVVPALDFSHIHARCDLCLRSKEDFADVLARVKRTLKRRQFYIYVSGAKYSGNDEITHTPLKKSELKINPAIECIAEKKYDAFIIANSPILEHDALSIKNTIERFNNSNIS
jgi:deoxyribonuclease-4